MCVHFFSIDCIFTANFISLPSQTYNQLYHFLLTDSKIGKQFILLFWLKFNYKQRDTTPEEKVGGGEVGAVEILFKKMEIVILYIMFSMLC